jgi:hypothetical protein
VASGLAVRGCGSFDSHANQAAAAAQVGIGRVEERVLFEEAPVGDGAEAFQAREDVGEIRDAQLHFDFGVSDLFFAHISV